MYKVYQTLVVYVLKIVSCKAKVNVNMVFSFYVCFLF